MPDSSDQELERELREQQLGRLFVNARLFLKQQRFAEAQSAVEELNTLLPEDSQVCELQGDIFRQQGKRKEAQEAFKRAFELDGTNVDAERKYAQLVLFLGEEDRARRQQREVLADPTKKRDQPRSPGLAALYSLLFPGFGQLYTRRHEQGLVILAAGLIILMLLVNALVIVPVQKMGQEKVGHSTRLHGGLSPGEQLDLWSDQVRRLPGWEWLLIILGSLGFVALQGYSVIDAYLVARQEVRETEKLGI